MELYAPPTGEDPRLVLARMPTTAQRMREWAASADVVAIPSAGKTFLELGARECRWPFGEGRHMRFCGCKQTPESSYCSEHTAVAVYRDGEEVL